MAQIETPGEGISGGSEREASKPRVLWGVPNLPDHFVVHPSLFARFEAWHNGSNVLVVAAPDGHGKSSVISAWLRSRNVSEPVIWISSGEWITSRGDVWKTLINAMAETGLLAGHAIPTGLGDAITFAALQNLTQPVVVVFDDIDKADFDLDLDYLARIARQIPLVRAIVVVSRLEPGHLPNPADPLVFGASDLAWESSMVDSAYSARLGIALSAERSSEIIHATAGRAESIVRLVTLQQSGAAIETMQDGRPSREVMFDTSLAGLQLRDASWSDARALAVIALSLRAPRSLVDPSADNAQLDIILARLRDAGFIDRIETTNGGSSYQVALSQRAQVEAWAAEFLGADAAIVHSAGAAYNVRHNPGLAIRHLALLGRYDEAIAVLKERWWEIGDAVQVSEMRAALTVIPESSYRLDVEALAMCLLIDRIPSTDRSKRVDLEAWLVRESVRVLSALPADGGFLVTSAVLWAVLSQGRTRDAIELALDVARRAAELQWAVQVARSRELAVLVNAAAEVLLAGGLAEQATPLIRLAEELVVGSASAFAHFRTATLGAMANALDGDWVSAEALVLRANTTYARESWPTAQVEYSTTVATALISYARLDAVGMASAASWFDLFARDDPRWRAAARLSRAYALLFEGRPAAALAMLRQFTHRMQLVESQLPAALAAALGAELWIATGRPARAIDVLADLDSPENHSMCFAVQRASARLALGQPRLALSDTDECIRLGSQHSLQTLPSILVRRAIAHEVLGHTAAADEQFLDFLMLMQAVPVRAPLLNLVGSSLDSLVSRATRNHPALKDFLADFAAVVIEVSPLLLADPSASLLSERERRVLELLGTGATVSGIATVLFVSPNTVKSQISSIYRKLGISSRVQAADAAASMGLISD